MNVNDSGVKHQQSQDRPWWKSTWPLDRNDAVELMLGLLGVIALYALVGYLFTDWLAPNPVVDLDESWAQQLADSRTDGRNDLAHWGSFLADTPVKIGLTAFLVGAMLYRWRRWHEALFVAMTLAFEASAYAVSSTIVGRPRPDVVRLVESPVPTSFPSGHVAAATVYIALAVIVYWHSRSTLGRAAATMTVIIVPIVVAMSRMYQGMHFFSDVVGGIVLGLFSVWFCLRVLGAPSDAATQRAPGSTAPGMSVLEPSESP